MAWVIKASNKDEADERLAQLRAIEGVLEVVCAERDNAEAVAEERRERAKRAEAEAERLRAVVEAAREARHRIASVRGLDAVAQAWAFDALDAALAALDGAK
jgi:hypothetical protein